MALVGLFLLGSTSLAEEPYRVLSPAGNAPHSAVLLVPGCSGFAAVNGVSMYEERAVELQAAGYFVVFVNYLGFESNCAHVSNSQVGEAILEAAAWTRAHTGVDSSRISVIGWSYGGGGVLAALATMPPTSLPPIAKAVMYYPDCRGALSWSAPAVSALMLLGEIDDVARPALCDALAKQAPPDRLRVVVYSNARHAFDVRGLPERAEYPFGTLGYNAEAAAASWAAVLDFLK
jgi:dienelactone hydrolase